MKTLHHITTPFALLVAIWFTNGSTSLFAQQPHDHSHDGHDHAGHNHGAHDHSGETLAFRRTEWNELHFDDPAKAELHLKTLKQLGCEGQLANHSGHVDVTFRCVEWKTLDVANHELAEQWGAWLKTSGLEVSHTHVDPAFTKGPEVVEFRLVDWKSIHGDGSPESKRFVEALGQIGCDVSIETHDGHADIHYRAPVWRDIHLPDHATADQWMNWLKGHGFEVHHEH